MNLCRRTTVAPEYWDRAQHATNFVPAEIPRQVIDALSRISDQEAP
jgi:hypothetical protein